MKKMEKSYSVKKIEQKTIIFIATLSWKTLLGITDNIVEEVPIIILIDKSWTKLVFSIQGQSTDCYKYLFFLTIFFIFSIMMEIIISFQEILKKIFLVSSCHITNFLVTPLWRYQNFKNYYVYVNSFLVNASIFYLPKTSGYLVFSGSIK